MRRECTAQSAPRPYGDRMSQVTPPGWYPDDQDATRLRYWDGAAWTEARTPLAPPPVGVEQPELPAGTNVGTVFAWIFAALPIVSIVSSIIQSAALQGEIGQISISDNGTVNSPTVLTQTDPSSLIGYLITLLLYAAAVVLALFDHRALTRIGIVRPFHWAFAFIPYPLVYLIGRHVVLRKMTRTSGAPLWAHVAFLVLGVIGSFFWAMVVVAQLMNEITTMYPYGSYS